MLIPLLTYVEASGYYCITRYPGRLMLNVCSQRKLPVSETAGPAGADENNTAVTGRLIIFSGLNSGFENWVLNC